MGKSGKKQAALEPKPKRQRKAHAKKSEKEELEDDIPDFTAFEEAHRLLQDPSGNTAGRQIGICLRVIHDQLKQIQRGHTAAAAQTPIKPLYKSLDVHMDKAVGRLIVATCTPHDVSERLGALAHWDRHLFNSADDETTLRALSCSTVFETIKTDKWQTRVFNDFVKEKSFSESVQSKVYMHFTDRVNNFRKRFCDR